MKKTIAFIIILCIVAQAANGQKNFGVKAGVNMATQKKIVTIAGTTYNDSAKTFTGYQLGGFYKMHLKKNWMIAGEVNLNVIGSKKRYATESMLMNPDGRTYYFNNELGYLELPFSLQYKMSKLYVGIGPSISFLVFSKITNFEGKSYNADFYRSIDVAGHVLAGYSVCTKLAINLRYSYSFTDIEKQPNFFNTKNRFLNLSVLYVIK